MSPREDWFEVINSSLKTFGLSGPCRREECVPPWRHREYDLLLIEFGSGSRYWIRRDNLSPCTFK